MKTSKPFSTISYNTKEFLQHKLNELVNCRKISFFAFIEHFAEEDEKKNHIHLFIIPNGQFNTDFLLDYLLEYSSINSLPLGIIPVKSSKFGDWFMYTKHDIDYLAYKGQARKFQYSKDDFYVSDNDFFNEEIYSIDNSKLNKLKFLREAVSNGIPFEQLLFNGQIPFQQVYAYKQSYELLKEFMLNGFTYRNGRNNHL